MSKIQCKMSIRLNFCRSVPPEFLRTFLILGAVGKVCPNGYETVKGSVAIPRGGTTPTTVKKVAHGVQKAHLKGLGQKAIDKENPNNNV